MKQHVVITVLIAASLFTLNCYGQTAEPEFAKECGSRAFVSQPLTVPLRIARAKSHQREIPVGSVIRVFGVNGNYFGYDDTGVFRLSLQDFVVLSTNLDESIQGLGNISEFTRAFARGNYLLNVNRDKSLASFQQALAENPDDVHAQLGFALVQSNLSEKRRLLDEVAGNLKTVKLLAETHRAITDRDFDSMEKIAADDMAPALVYQEMLAHILLRAPELQIEARLKPLVDKATEFGAPPRLLNLNAMLLRSPALQDLIPSQARAEGSIAACRMAIRLDPYYYHAHMSLGELYAAGGYDAEASSAYEKALRLHPLLIPALKGYMRSTQGVEQADAGPSFLTQFQLERVVKALMAVHNSDLPEQPERIRELMVHGFLPVNHGGSQPMKIDLLEARGASEAIRYLKLQLGF